MNSRNLLAACTAGIFLGAAAGAFAADEVPLNKQSQDQVQQQIQTQEQVRERSQVHGSELMTPEERSEHQSKMRSMKTEQEREAYRLEHHKRMQEKALEQGKEMPSMPPAKGGGGGKGR